MAAYVVLAQYTDQAIRTVKHSLQQAGQAAEMVKGFGCEMKEVYWTLGQTTLSRSSKHRTIKASPH
jgi:uncharacterized protein with GYD domain